MLFKFKIRRQSLVSGSAKEAPRWNYLLVVGIDRAWACNLLAISWQKHIFLEFSDNIPRWIIESLINENIKIETDYETLNLFLSSPTTNIFPVFETDFPTPMYLVFFQTICVKCPALIDVCSNEGFLKKSYLFIDEYQ